MQTTKLTNILLSNASHEGKGNSVSSPSDLHHSVTVRTPLNHIIKFVAAHLVYLRRIDSHLATWNWLSMDLWMGRRGRTSTSLMPHPR